MFKERLKLVVKFVKEGLLALFFVTLFYSALTSLAIIGSKIVIIATILKYILFVFLGLIALSSIVTFVWWLFVEPYKEHEKNKK